MGQAHVRFEAGKAGALSPASVARQGGACLDLFRNDRVWHWHPPIMVRSGGTLEVAQHAAPFRIQEYRRLAPGSNTIMAGMWQ
eukprot:4803926-Amphidinium_carterae.1